MKNKLLSCYANRMDISQCDDIENIRNDADIFAKDITDCTIVKNAVEFSSPNGYLLKALKDKGVNVLALESKYFPMQGIPEDILPYDKYEAFKSANKSPKFFYDLGIMLNVVPYLNDEEALNVIKKLCNCCSDILFSFENDYENPYLNTHNLDFWSYQFAKNGFFRDVDCPLGKKYEGIYKFSKNMVREKIVQEYERDIISDKSHIKGISLENEEKTEDIDVLLEKIALLEKRLKKEQLTNKKFAVTIRESESKIKKLNKKYEEVMEFAEDYGYEDEDEKESCDEDIPSTDSTKKDKDKKKKKRKKRVVDKDNDTDEPETKVYVIAEDPNEEKLHELFCGKSLDVGWFMSSKDALNQRRRGFGQNIKFSILMKVTDTIECEYLIQTLDSVINQTYVNWELCIAFLSDREATSQEELLKDYIRKFSNIKYTRVKGDVVSASEIISAAYSLATGDMVSLLWQADVIHPASLYETLLAVTHEGADMIYTDEAIFRYTCISLDTKLFKPQFALNSVVQYNYINRFSSFKRELLEKVGGFDSSTETNEFHDLMLRLSEKAKKVYHLQKLFYFRREGCIEKCQSAMGAIRAYLDRNNLKACVTELDNGIYGISYKAEKKPLVSVIVTNIGEKSALKMCIDSIVYNTAYNNYEIIIIDKAYENEDDKIFDRQVSQDLLHCAWLFEKYDAYLDEESLLTMYNKRFTEREKKLFEKSMQELKERTENEDNILRKDIQSHAEVTEFISWADNYNKSLMNNYGAKKARGDYCVFMDSQVTVKNKQWLDNFVAAMENDKVGIVSAEIVNSCGLVESMGITHSNKKLVRHLYFAEPIDSYGYLGGLKYPYPCSEIDSMCFMVRKEQFFQTAAFTKDYPVYFSSHDLSLKYRENGYIILTIPSAKAEKHTTFIRESLKLASADIDETKETKVFLKEWGRILHRQDPFYNQHFTEKGKTFVEDLEKDTSGYLHLKVLQE